ncbi:MAG: ATP synthase subunit I [Cyanobacteria bacterium J06592_8]
MILSNSIVETTPPEDNSSDSGVLDPEPDNSIEEYHQLQQDLLILTVILTGVIFVTVCCFYPLKIALNYLLGAVGSVVYLRMLAKDVEKLGRQQQRLSKARLAIVIGLIVVATQWKSLSILPVFLGFLTYKAALILYVLKEALMPENS